MTDLNPSRNLAVRPCAGFFVAVLMLGVLLAASGPAQTFTTLHSFAGFPSDGVGPFAGLILSGNTLYGTAYSGGSSGKGTVFKVNTDGTGFTTLHNFAGYPSDGAYPYGGLILSGNTLYGTAHQGGSSGFGTVFALNTDGTGFTTLHSFTARSDNNTNSDGYSPLAGSPAQRTVPRRAKKQIPISISKLLERARQAVDGIPQDLRKFNAIQKAYIHTWLAWQETPGKPMGEAIKAKYLDPNNSHAQALVNWLKRLFDIPI